MRGAYSVQIRWAGVIDLSHVLVDDAIDAEDAKRQVTNVMPRNARLTGVVFLVATGSPLVVKSKMDGASYAVKVGQGELSPGWEAHCRKITLEKP